MPVRKIRRSPRPLVRDLRDLLKPILLFTGAIGVTFLAWKFHLQDRLPETQAWIQSLGALGPWAFLALNSLGVMIALPAVLFNLAAGALFGVGLGSVLSLSGGLIGASGAFLIARYVARDSVKRWVGHHPWMKHLEERTQRYDAPLVVATRILPVFPFNLVNYAWGLTGIRFVPYVVWTLVGKAPNFIFFVALGASASGLSKPLLWVLGVTALAMALASVWLKGRLSNSARGPQKNAPRKAFTVKK